MLKHIYVEKSWEEPPGSIAHSNTNQSGMLHMHFAIKTKIVT